MSNIVTATFHNGWCCKFLQNHGAEDTKSRDFQGPSFVGCMQLGLQFAGREGGQEQDIGRVVLKNDGLWKGSPLLVKRGHMPHTTNQTKMLFVQREVQPGSNTTFKKYKL